MKIFTKLALVSSIAISANAMAMQSIDDTALGAITGQDGLSISIGLGENTALGNGQKGITIDSLYVHDNDGLAVKSGGENPTVTPGVAGAIVISGVTVKQTDQSRDLAILKIDTDGGTGADGAFLNVAADIAATTISIDSIGVAKSGNITTSTASRGTTGDVAPILSGLTINMGAMTANVQLGNSPQGALIKLKTDIIGGLDINNLALSDNSAHGGGNLVVDKIMVRGQGNTTGDIKVDTDISVTTTGLKLQNNSEQALNVYAQGIRLGSADASSIGDLEISGLRTGKSTITIMGH